MDKNAVGKFGPATSPPERWILGLILAGFSIICAAGMLTDLPFARASTETRMVQLALKYGSGDLNPHFFEHPPLFSYALFGIYALSFAVGRLLGGFSSVADFEKLVFVDPSLFYALARCFNLLLGLASIVVVHRLGRRCFKRPEIALLGAFFFAGSYILSLSARYASCDVAQMFLALAALFPILDILEYGEPRRYVWAGLLTGLAAAAKYPAGWLAIAIVTAHALRGATERTLGWGWWWNRNLLKGLAMCGVGFLIGCPFALLDYPTFLKSLNIVTDAVVITRNIHFESFHTQGPGAVFLAVKIFPGMVGVLLSVACAWGVFSALRRREKLEILLCVHALSFTAFLSTWSEIKARYFLFVLPIFLLLAARALVEGLDRIPGARFVLPVLALLLVAQPARDQVRLARAASSKPAPLLAKEWVQRHVPPGTAIAAVGELGLFPNITSIERQLTEIRSKNLGPGIRLQRMRRYAEDFPKSYDVWWLFGPWIDTSDKGDFDFDALRRAGVRYFALGGEEAGYRAEPRRYAVQAGFYDRVRAECALDASFNAEAPDYDPGYPTGNDFINIYRLGKGGAGPGKP